ATMVKAAEERYSAERLQSLGHEWRTIWPHITHTAKLFYGLREHLLVSDITEPFLVERFSDIAEEIADAESDPITRSLGGLCSSGGNFNSIRNFVLREFFVTGLIGIKTGPTDSVHWSRLNMHSQMSAGDVRPSSTIYVHPMFYRALGIKYD